MLNFGYVLPISTGTGNFLVSDTLERILDATSWQNWWTFRPKKHINPPPPPPLTLLTPPRG